VLECLPSKCETLSLIPSSKGKKKGGRGKGGTRKRGEKERRKGGMEGERGREGRREGGKISAWRKFNVNIITMT
jgi:hypothetical protein